jgi:long-subunit acyl-CoA synthetase (AMP-forming)
MWCACVCMLWCMSFCSILTRWCFLSLFFFAPILLFCILSALVHTPLLFSSRAARLAQGEFVAVEQLENVFQKSKYVEQIFIHADRLQSFVVAVVVPSQATVARALSDHTVPSSANTASSSAYPKLDEESARIKLLMRDFQVLAAEAQLASWEVPRWLVLEQELSFTAENHLLTASHKLNRRALTAHYQTR